MAGDNFDNDLPPWLMDDDDQQPANSGSGMTGQLPWRQEAAGDESGQAPSDGVARVDWEAGAAQGGDRPADPFKGMTGTLPWNAQASGGVPSQGDEFASWLDTSEQGQAQSASPVDDMPSWLQDDDDAPTYVEAPVQATPAGDDAMPAWLFDEESAGQPAAPQQAAPSVDFGAAADDEFPTWLQDDDVPPAASPEPPPIARIQPLAQVAPAADDEFPAWLQDDDSVPAASPVTPQPPAISKIQPLSPAAPSSDEGLPDWLFDEAGEQPAPPADSFGLGSPEMAQQAPEAQDDLNWMAAAEPPVSEEMSYEDWARQNLPAEEQSDLNWMEEPSPYETDSAADMTYEEWERQQNAAEQAATAEPEIELPEDLPDLLGSIEESGGAPPASADYVPEWFMGVEELDASAAPDWLKGTDLVAGGSGLLKTPAAPEPPPPPPSSLDAMLPDFSAVIGGQASADVPPPPDFSAMMGDMPLPDMSAVVGAPPEPEPPQPRIKRLGDSTPLTAETEAVAFDDLFSDDLAAEPPSDAAPDFDALFGGMDDEAMPSAPELPKMEQFEEGGEAEPNWLQGYDQASELAELDAQQAKPAAAELKRPSTGELPDWFQDIDFTDMPAPTEAAAPVVVTRPAPSAEEDFDLDALLGTGDLELPPAPAPSALTDMSGSADLGFDDDFLSGFAMPTQAPPAGVPSEEGVFPGEGMPLAGVDLEESGELPAWMQHLSTSADEYVLKVGGVEGRFEQVPAVVLPQDLRELREQIADHLAQAERKGILIDQGILAGIEGALEADPDLITPGLLALDRVYDVSDSQQMRLDALQRVLQTVRQETDAERIQIRYDLQQDEDVEDAERDLASKPHAVTKRRVHRKPDRWLITLLLMVVMGLPFAVDNIHIADDPPLALDEEAAPIAAAVDSLETSSSAQPKLVLVAFEYSPAASQELDPLGEAVLRDVLAHGGVPVVVSTNPMGILHAREVMSGLAEDETLTQAIGRGTALRTPRHYVVLRYLAGGAVGVRSLITSPTAMATYFAYDITGEKTNLEIDSLNAENFAFMLVIGERYDDTRLWAEQLKNVPIPKFALTTAAAEPITRPYVEAKTYEGILSGYRGALMYDSARNAETKTPYKNDTDFPDPDFARWQSATLGALLAAAFIAIGSLFNLLRGFRRTRRRTL